MIEFRINGVALVLFPDTGVELEYQNAAQTNEFADAYSMPFSVPVKGNEVALGYVAEIPLRERTIQWDNAEHYEGGMLIAPGTIYYEGGDDEVANLSFSSDAFVSRYQDRKLREMDLGDLISVPDMATHAKEVNLLAYPAADYAFPMYYNPSFYGSENPSWFPSASPWVPGQSYAVNALVRFTDMTQPIWREGIYQCISATSSFSPNSAVHWRRAEFGVVNRWDPDTVSFRTNDADGNFYALSPWFYLKAVLKRMATALNLDLQGDFIGDPNTDQLLLFGDRALDGQSRSEYFRVTEPTPFTLTGTTFADFPLQATDETTVPNGDADSLWATDTYTQPTWPALALTSFVFRFKARITFSTPKPLKLFLIDAGTVDGLDPFTSALPYALIIDTTPRLVHDLDRTEWIMVQDGSLAQGIRAGRTYKWTLQDPAATVASYSATVEDLLIQRWTVDIEGWTTDATNPVNAFSNEFKPNECMPDTTVGALCAAVAEACGVRVCARNGVLRVDYKQVLNNADPQDITDKVRSKPAFDITMRKTGLRIAYDADTEPPDLTMYRYIDTYDSFADAVAPSGPGEYCIIRSTRELLLSVPYIDGFHWKASGLLLSTIDHGDASEDEKITLAPTSMTVVSLDGKKYVVPLVDTEASTDFYGNVATDTPLRFAYFEGMQANTTSETYPFATPFRRLEDGTSLGTSGDLEDGHYEEFIEGTVDLCILAEPMTMDVEVPMAFLIDRRYEKPVIVGNQKYVFISLPMSFNTGRGPLMANGARLYRIPPA